MRTTFLSGLALVSLCAGAGCVPRGALYEAEFPAEAEPSAPATAVAVGEVNVVDDAPLEGSARVVAIPLSSRDRSRPDPVFFHLGAGYGVLGRIDVSPCRDRGLPTGYLRLRATFRPSGRVAHAAIETIAEPPQEALTCIGEQLEGATVPPFDGGDVTLSRVYFVD